MPETIGYSYASGGEIDTTWTAFAPAEDSEAPRALALPARVRLDNLAVRLTGLSGSPTQLTAFLARAANGTKKVTNSNTSGAVADLDFLEGSSTEADVVFDLEDLAVVWEAADVPTVMLQLDTGAGTGVEVRLSWRRA